jgi:type I restriction enzyme R subunit
MYLDRSLKEHKLLQTIARVNRPKEGKDFGYIIDYYGVIQKLNDALELYSDDNYSGNYSNEYEVEELSDINELFNDVNVEIGKLPQKHSELWDIFKGVAKDFEAYSQLLRHEETRQLFYERLTAYASCLKIALSSMSFHKAVGEETLERYREDLKMFLRLRQAVQARYSDTIDYKKYEVQIQKLIDRHVESGEIKILVEQVDIFDKEDFAKELEKIMGKAAQADTIASRTAKHITEYLDTDPAFYKKFSDLLKETIALYEQGRIDEIEYLKKVTEIKEKILARTDSDIPAEIAGNNTARAYFGIITEVFRALLNSSDQITALNTALAMDKIIRKYIFDNGEPIVEWKSKLDLIGRMKIEMEDYLIDEIRELQGVPLSFDDMDNIINRSVEVAKLWLK